MELLNDALKYNLTDLPDLIPDSLLEKFKESIKIFENLYLKNKKWVIAYSGGKDSTSLVVLALFMKELHPDIDLRITYSDTLMEIPQMYTVAYSFLEGIKKRFPVNVIIVYPDIQDTFWVRMIGRGYPPPGPRFRWCTDKLKIKPSRKINQNEGIFITGMRLGESKKRDERLVNTCLIGVSSECGNNAWMEQNGIDVAAPIIQWTTKDVWDFLFFSARKVIPEVQLVINLYGNTALRFGCWMCTVVSKDKTMEILSKAGDWRVTKLLEFKNWIIKESNKSENRYSKKDGKLGRLKLDLRQKILKKLLNLQEELGIKLIDDKEITEINRLILSGKYAEYT